MGKDASRPVWPPEARTPPRRWEASANNNTETKSSIARAALVGKRFFAARSYREDGGESWVEMDTMADARGDEFSTDWLAERSSLDLFQSTSIYINNRVMRRRDARLFYRDFIVADVDGLRADSLADAEGRSRAVFMRKGWPLPNEIRLTSEKGGAFGLHFIWRHRWVFLLTETGQQLHRDVSRRICEALRAEGLPVDVAASCNLRGMLRVLGSVHQETGTRVRCIGPVHNTCPSILTLKTCFPPIRRNLALTLNSEPARMPQRPRRPARTHEQIMAIAGGVHVGLRNSALCTLTYSNKVDNVPFDQALADALAFNDRCPTPEDPRKVRDVVGRIYRDGLGLSAKEVAAVATAAGFPCRPAPELIVPGSRPGRRRPQPQQHQRVVALRAKKRPGPAKTTGHELLRRVSRLKSLLLQAAKTGAVLTLQQLADRLGYPVDALKRPGRRRQVENLISQLYQMRLQRAEKGMTVKIENLQGNSEVHSSPARASIKQVSRARGCGPTTRGGAGPPLDAADRAAFRALLARWAGGGS